MMADHNNRCRLCCREIQNEIHYDCLQHADLLNNMSVLLQLKIDASDNLTKNVCTPCEAKLTEFAHFLGIVRQTQERLVSPYSSSAESLSEVRLPVSESGTNNAGDDDDDDDDCDTEDMLPLMRPCSVRLVDCMRRIIPPIQRTYGRSTNGIRTKTLGSLSKSDDDKFVAEDQQQHSKDQLIKEDIKNNDIKNSDRASSCRSSRRSKSSRRRRRFHQSRKADTKRRSRSSVGHQGESPLRKRARSTLDHVIESADDQRKRPRSSLRLAMASIENSAPEPIKSSPTGRIQTRRATRMYEASNSDRNDSLETTVSHVKAALSTSLTSSSPVQSSVEMTVLPVTSLAPANMAIDSIVTTMMTSSTTTLVDTQTAAPTAEAPTRNETDNGVVIPVHVMCDPGNDEFSIAMQLISNVDALNGYRVYDDKGTLPDQPPSEHLVALSRRIFQLQTAATNNVPTSSDPPAETQTAIESNTPSMTIDDNNSCTIVNSAVDPLACNPDGVASEAPSISNDTNMNNNIEPEEDECLLVVDEYQTKIRNMEFKAKCQKEAAAAAKRRQPKSIAQRRKTINISSQQPRKIMPKVLPETARVSPSVAGSSNANAGRQAAQTPPAAGVADVVQNPPRIGNKRRMTLPSNVVDIVRRAQQQSIHRRAMLNNCPNVDNADVGSAAAEASSNLPHLKILSPSEVNHRVAEIYATTPSNAATTSTNHHQPGQSKPVAIAGKRRQTFAGSALAKQKPQQQPCVIIPAGNAIGGGTTTMSRTSRPNGSNGSKVLIVENNNDIDSRLRNISSHSNRAGNATSAQTGQTNSTEICSSSNTVDNSSSNEQTNALPPSSTTSSNQMRRFIRVSGPITTPFNSGNVTFTVLPGGGGPASRSVPPTTNTTPTTTTTSSSSTTTLTKLQPEISITAVTPTPSTAGTNKTANKRQQQMASKAGIANKTMNSSMTTLTLASITMPASTSTAMSTPTTTYQQRPYVVFNRRRTATPSNVIYVSSASSSTTTSFATNSSQIQPNTPTATVSSASAAMATPTTASSAPIVPAVEPMLDSLIKSGVRINFRRPFAITAGVSTAEQRATTAQVPIVSVRPMIAQRRPSSAMMSTTATPAAAATSGAVLQRRRPSSACITLVNTAAATNANVVSPQTRTLQIQPVHSVPPGAASSPQRIRLVNAPTAPTAADIIQLPKRAVLIRSVSNVVPTGAATVPQPQMRSASNNVAHNDGGANTPQMRAVSNACATDDNMSAAVVAGNAAQPNGVVETRNMFRIRLTVSPVQRGHLCVMFKDYADRAIDMEHTPPEQLERLRECLCVDHQMAEIVRAFRKSPPDTNSMRIMERLMPSHVIEELHRLRALHAVAAAATASNSDSGSGNNGGHKRPRKPTNRAEDDEVDIVVD